ncbi:MAG: LON peptidase substrate-binding domain-containing protein [Pseudomonadales bacterium]|nr:LON peptidase substrate-binding domain-containing protein [Pseudomonadales bacterium]
MNKISLFPLPLVIFPGGRLPLQIFEKRYLDMIKSCLREGKGFGVIMIESGDQVIRDSIQKSAHIARQGTYCKVIDFDQQTNGLLQIVLMGEKKFRVESLSENDDRLQEAKVNFLNLETDTRVPADKKHLVELLNTLVSHVSTQGLAFNEESAIDVGARLSELLPCANQFKQEMLELEDPLIRLELIEEKIQRMQKEV